MSVQSAGTGLGNFGGGMGTRPQINPRALKLPRAGKGMAAVQT